MPHLQKTVQKATRRTLADWKLAGRRRLLIGALVLVGSIILLVGVFLLANRLNARGRIPAVNRPSVEFSRE